MRRLFLILLFSALIVLPCFSQDAADREVARTQDYIKAATMKGVEKINALKAYIQKFPEKDSRWTKLAHYSLAIEYFQLKNYAEAIKIGEKTFTLGSVGAGEDVRLALVIANCYGIKNSPSFNQQKALKYANKAISLAGKANDPQAKKEAEKLKGLLSAPAKPNLTPEQKLKRHYSMEEYSDVVSVYKSMSAADKGKTELHELYAKALLKSDNLTGASNEFTALYAKEKKATYALNLAKIYAQKGKRNRALLSKAIDYYLEAGLLYEKEGSSSNKKAAFGKAQYFLFEKYGFNKKVDALNRKARQNKSSAQKNEAEIKKLERELKKHDRRIRREYDALDMEPPPYEATNRQKIVDKIETLKAGGSAEDNNEWAKLEEEKKKILKEFDDLKKKAKVRLGL